MTRGEVGVPALGRAGQRPAADAHQLRLAKAGARRDHRHRAVGPRLARPAASAGRRRPARPAHRPAPRRHSAAGLARPGSRLDRFASIIHGWLVSCATWATTGPATPNAAADTWPAAAIRCAGSRPRSRRATRRGRSRSGARRSSAGAAEPARRDPAASWCRRRRRPERLAVKWSCAWSKPGL